MKNLKRIILLLSIILITNTSYADKKGTALVTYKVEMDCQSCVNKIKRIISFEKGVKNLDVDFGTKLVTITYKTKATNKEKLKKALEKMGYKTEEQK